MIVQRFAGEIIPDSRAIVRYAVDEQSEIVDQRINSLSDEVRKSVREMEGGLSQLHQVVQDKHHAMFRSPAAFEDQTNAEIEKFERRLSSPTASSADRAASSGTDVNVRELTTRVGILQSEHDRHAMWASQSIGDLQDEFRTLADRAPLPVLTPESGATGNSSLPIGLGTLMTLRIGALQLRRITGGFRISLAGSIAKLGITVPGSIHR